MPIGNVAEPRAETNWERVQGQRTEARTRALGKLVKHKPVEKAE